METQAYDDDVYNYDDNNDDIDTNDNDRGPPIAKIVRYRNGVRQEWSLYQGI